MALPITGTASLVLAIVFGFIFGLLLQRGRVANYNVIVNQFRLKGLHRPESHPSCWRRNPMCQRKESWPPSPQRATKGSWLQRHRAHLPRLLRLPSSQSWSTSRGERTSCTPCQWRLDLLNRPSRTAATSPCSSMREAPVFAAKDLDTILESISSSHLLRLLKQPILVNITRWIERVAHRGNERLIWYCNRPSRTAATSPCSSMWKLPFLQPRIWTPT